MCQMSLKIACASDIHGKFGGIAWPEADMLVLAGDILTNISHDKRTDAFLQLIYIEDTLNPFIGILKKFYEHIVFIPGNHDRCFELNRREATEKLSNAIVLIDEATQIGKYKFYGSPWQPWFFGHHWSFNLPDPEDNAARAKAHAIRTWDAIPLETDILITHGPPRGILDTAPGGVRVGCPHLLDRVKLVKPLLHIFGHIHEGYGITTQNGTVNINASVCKGNYSPDNQIQVVEV